MKKITALTLSVLLMLSLAACGSQTPPVEEKKTYAGLTAAFVGDSITNGAQLAKGELRYWENLKNDLSLGEVIGLGVNGSCYSTLSEFGLDHEPLVTRYEQIPATDLIFIFMGTNDFGRSTPMGTIADQEDVSFYGAMNKVLNELEKLHPESQVVLLTPIIRYDKVQNNLGLKLTDYVEAIKAVARERELPLIDTQELTKASLPEGVFADTVHPDKYGHKILSDTIKAWLEENIDTVLQ